METKFKIGDRIELIENYTSLLKGTKGEIIELDMVSATPAASVLFDGMNRPIYVFIKRLKLINMNNELTVQKDRVLQEASKCSTFKRIAEGLWPEIFNEEIRYKHADSKRFIIGDVEHLFAAIDDEKCNMISNDGRRWGSGIKKKYDGYTLAELNKHYPGIKPL